MKTRNLILFGGIGLAAAYLFLMRKRTSQLAPAASPVDTQDAIEPAAPPATKESTDLTLGNLFKSSAPSRLSGYTQVFNNRVYTKVKDLYGEDANTGLYPESKKLGLYQRIWMNLTAKGVSNPNNATLGQIGPALKDIAQEGFNYKHRNTNQRAPRTLRGGVGSTTLGRVPRPLGGRRNI